MVIIMVVCRSLNISIEMLIINPEISKIVLDHLKTKKMCKHAVKKLFYVIRYVSDQHKTEQTCDKVIIENAGTSKSVCDCYKNQEMSNKAVGNYPHTLEFVSERYNSQKMCDKAFDTYLSTINSSSLKKYVIKQLIYAFFVFYFMPNCFKTEEMCDRVVPEDALFIVYWSDNYITQKMCDEAVDNSLATLTLIFD